MGSGALRRYTPPPVAATAASGAASSTSRVGPPTVVFESGASSAPPVRDVVAKQPSCKAEAPTPMLATGSDASRPRLGRSGSGVSIDCDEQRQMVGQFAKGQLIYSGQLWKLNYGACEEVASEWLPRKMWLASAGGLFYFSRHEHFPVGCSTLDLRIGKRHSPVCGRFLIELHARNQAGAIPTLLGLDSEVKRDEWFDHLLSTQVAERDFDPADDVDLVEFTNAGVGSKNRFRLLGQSSPANIVKRPMPANATSTTEAGGLLSVEGCRTPRSNSKLSSTSQASSLRHPVFRKAPSLSLLTSKSTRCDDFNKENTVIVLDWDDTIFPTTFLRKDCGLDWRRSIEEQVEPNDARDELEIMIRKLSSRVETFLHEACKLGHVVILTLAKSPWVTHATKTFMPAIGNLIEEYALEVVYAQDLISKDAEHAFEHSNPFKPIEEQTEYWVQAKARAMTAAFNSIREKDGAGTKNLISIGDSDVERFALLQCAGNRAKAEAKSILQEGPTWEFYSRDDQFQRLCAKTVKLLDNPSCEEMIAQLNIMVDWLRHVVKKDSGFDVDLKNSDDDTQLNSLHSFFTGEAGNLTWLQLAGIDAAESKEVTCPESTDVAESKASTCAPRDAGSASDFSDE